MTRNAFIVKSFGFEASHQLPNHDGKCRNLHGHSYKMEVILRGDLTEDAGSPKEGMVVDFGDVSSIVKELIIERLDHRFLAKGDEQVEIPEEQIMVLGVRTTAENIAGWALDILLRTDLQKYVYGIRLWETTNGRAEVYV